MVFLVLGQSIVCPEGRQTCEDGPHCYDPECCDSGAPGLQNISGSQRHGYGWVSKRSSLLSYLISYYSWVQQKGYKIWNPREPQKWQPTPVFLPGESQGRGSLVGCLYGVAQSRTWLKRLSSSSSSRATEGLNILSCWCKYLYSVF